MRNERGSFDFEARKSTLELILRLAITHGRLDGADYSKLLRRTREAKTLREIREIREELNKILGEKRRKQNDIYGSGLYRDRCGLLAQ